MKANAFVELNFASDTVQPVGHTAQVFFWLGYLFKSNTRNEKGISQRLL